MTPWRRKVVPNVGNYLCACRQFEKFQRPTIEAGNGSVTECLRRMERSTNWCSVERVERPPAKEGDGVIVNSLRPETYAKLPIKC